VNTGLTRLAYILFLVAAISSPAAAQRRSKASPPTVPQEPQKWVNNHECDPSSLGYAETIALPAGTITPPVTGLGPYTCTSGTLDSCSLSLQHVMSDWATNTDGQGHNLDRAWHIVISHGTLINLFAGDIQIPAKSSATKCVVIESDQALTEQTACSHGITDSATRNPGCTNDLSKMYTFRLDKSSLADAVLFPAGSNHVVIRDAEFTLKPGINQSQSGAAGPDFVRLQGNDIGLDRTYIHGFDPGDSEFGLTSTKGDDVGDGVQFKCATCWLTNSYMEKIHQWNSESHGIGGGFSTGPYKIVSNWIEGASEALIFGGGPVDTNGGPEADVEIRRNRFTHDLNWRTLTGAAGNSPSGNYGCAPNCLYKWGLKNNFELKMGQRILIDGNILENMWPDGQTGENITTATRVCSGGQRCGVFLPNGLPATVVSDLTFTNDIVRNAVNGLEGVGGARSSLLAGDGGGVSQGGNRSTHKNLLAYNLGDNNQFGGTGSHIFQIGAGGNDFSCTMSRTGGVAKAVCQPTAECVGGSGCSSKAVVTSLSRDGSGNVTMKFSNRQDAIVGATVVVTGAPTGSGGTNFNGSFPIATAGIGAAPPQLTYQQALGADTSCTSGPTCNAVVATFPSLGASIHDISVGDFVYVSVCSGGSSPTDYQVGASNPGVPAISPTIPNSLTVYYNNPLHPDDSSGTICNVNNHGGWSQNMVWDHVTVAVPTGTQMLDAYGSSSLPVNNQFTNSIYVFNGPSNLNGFYCTGASGSPKEGTVAENCYDASSLAFHHNVLQGRTGTNYTTFQNSGGIVCSQQGGTGNSNCFPATATCAGGTVSLDANGHPTCVGFSGFMNGIAFPIVACTSPASSPGGCLLMSPPYGTFDYHQLALTGTSTNNPYKAGGIDNASDAKDMGADINSIDNALTRTQYVCTGSCGSPGPYHD
jgi:hypothetical protein